MRRKRILSLIAVFGLLATLVMPAAKEAYAASLTDVTVALTNDATGATDNIVITFTPNTAITDGSVLEVTYDTGFTGGAALTDSDVAVTGTNITSSAETGFIAGYFKSTLTCGGSVTTTVTITIDGTNELTNPGSAGNYPWSVTADIGGAGTSFDYGAGLAYVADDNDVTVTATVPPTIDMEIYEQNSATPTNACALGVLTLSQVKNCVYDVAGATNNGAGMTIKVQGVDTTDWSTGEAYLEHSNNTDNIDAVSDGTVSTGAEEYGFQITDDGSSNQWAGAGNYETQNEPVPTTETSFASTSATIDGINTQADRLEVTHYAGMATDTVVGSYTHGIVYTAYTN